jgi:16S rRNA (cytosine967-C5)-methyltransferase
VAERNAYANLVLPRLLREHSLTGRDAALATELAYGTARASGLLDAVLAECCDRPLERVEPAALDALRLGAYQLLRTRIPAHAAISTSVDIAADAAGQRVRGFVNAVLRRVSELSEAGWVDTLAPGGDIGRLALATAHPEWIARAFAQALGETGEELAAALAADDERPAVHLAARPGGITADTLAAVTGGEPAPYSPYGVRLNAGDPGSLEPVRERLATVQDEGSQLCALALTRAPVDGGDNRWLDLCAGPGGKAAMLGALAGRQGGELVAVDTAEHRARLVGEACAGLPVTVHVADGRNPGLDGGFDRVLVDAPCTGLGALRRRPEARWRRTPADVAELSRLQRELLASAIGLARPGGLVCYSACTPHLPETAWVVRDTVRRTGVGVLDTREFFPGVPRLGDGSAVQLWPHRHGTDAMFCALLRT